MSSVITYTIPQKTASCFVVATDQPPGDLDAPARWELDAPYDSAVRQRLGTPRLQLDAFRASVSPWDVAQVEAAYEEDEGQVTRARKAKHHIGVTAIVPVGDLPFGCQVARALARAIAKAAQGVPIDFNTGQVLPDTELAGGPRGGTAERERFILADEWLGAWLPHYRNNGRCTASASDVNGCDCVAFTTRGLRRFALPELYIDNIACPHDLAALNVLRSTAQWLMTNIAGAWLRRPEGKHGLSCTIPRNIILSGADFAAYWGSTSSMWPGPFPVRLTELAKRLIAIEPPGDFAGTANEWLRDESTPTNLHDLVSTTPDPG